MLLEMRRLVDFGLRNDRCMALSSIYSLINQNKRDSPRWQAAFIKAGGVKELLNIWKQVPSPAGAAEPALSAHYWVVAIFGRMMGTCEVSRAHLMQEGAVDVILAA